MFYGIDIWKSRIKREQGVKMIYPKIKDFRDFIDKADKIKELYGGVLSDKFNLEYVCSWRNYIYSKTNISLKFRHLMWEYLNEDVTKMDLISIYLSTRK